MTGQPYFLRWGLGGLLLVLSSAWMLVGVTLWTGRNMWDWPSSESAGYLRWERGMIMAAIVFVVLGLARLEGELSARGELVVGRLGLVTYLMAATLGIVAESYHISGREPMYALIVVYVVMAYLGQSAFGVSLLLANVLPAWIGWSAIVWNLACLALLVTISPADIYYPVAHHIIPLFIGVALLVHDL